MRATKRIRSLKVPTQLVDQMPRGVRAQREIITLGLQQWRVRRALEKYRLGKCTLAFAAQEARITLREIIPLAYAFGIEPAIDPHLLDQALTSVQAAQL